MWLRSTPSLITRLMPVIWQLRWQMSYLRAFQILMTTDGTLLPQQWQSNRLQLFPLFRFFQSYLKQSKTLQKPPQLPPNLSSSTLKPKPTQSQLFPLQHSPKSPQFPQHQRSNKTLDSSHILSSILKSRYPQIPFRMLPQPLKYHQRKTKPHLFILNCILQQLLMSARFLTKVW